MRIHQIRKYEVFFEDGDEEIEHDGRLIESLGVHTTEGGAAVVTIRGISMGQKWSEFVKVDAMDYRRVPGLKEFLDKLSLMRIDEMTWSEFMAAEEPVG